MSRVFFIITLVCFSNFLNSQSVNRVQVKGAVFSDDNDDVNSVTIFNISSNEGTITNESGEFTIAVAINDIIEISALQFNTVSISIDEVIIKSKQLQIQLAEQVNQLDTVLISSGLSGNINVDINNVKTIKQLEIDMGFVGEIYEYNDEKAFDNSVLTHELNSITNKGKFYNGINFAKLLGFNNISFKWKKKSLKQYYEPRTILDIYSKEFIHTTFSIPLEDIENFIVFVEKGGIDSELFKPENEIQLIDFIVKQSKEFLKLNDAEN